MLPRVQSRQLDFEIDLFLPQVDLELALHDDKQFFRAGVFVDDDFARLQAARLKCLSELMQVFLGKLVKQRNRAYKSNDVLSFHVEPPGDGTSIDDASQLGKSRSSNLHMSGGHSCEQPLRIAVGKGNDLVASGRAAEVRPSSNSAAVSEKTATAVGIHRSGQAIHGEKQPRRFTPAARR